MRLMMRCAVFVLLALCVGCGSAEIQELQGRVDDLKRQVATLEAKSNMTAIEQRYVDGEAANWFSQHALNEVRMTESDVGKELSKFKESLAAARLEYVSVLNAEAEMLEKMKTRVDQARSREPEEGCTADPSQFGRLAKMAGYCESEDGRFVDVAH